MRTEERAYEVQRGIERAKQEARLEATIQRTILIAVAAILIGYFLAVFFLIKGVLFGKSKNVRIFSALGLLALAIGTTVLVKYVRSKFMDNQLPATSEEKGFKSKSQSNHMAETTQLARASDESKETVDQSDSQLSESEARPPTVQGKSEEERQQEGVKAEYRCRFCGLYSFDKEKDGQVACKKAPRVGGKDLMHDFVPSEDYVEPVEKMCIKCGSKTRFPEFFLDENCKFGLGHEFYKTLITEPKMQDCDLHKDSSHVCVYCGRFTSYPTKFSNGECSGCLPPTQRGHHRFVTKEEYVGLATVQCEKCGINTKVPELRADEGCEKGGRHKFPVKHASSNSQSPTVQMTSEIKSKEVDEDPTELPQGVSRRSVRGSQSKSVISQETNPHVEAAKKYNWQAKCQKEWRKSFLELQRVFSVFGGFQLAQPPIDGIELDTRGRDSENIQKDVPLRTPYRYFKSADLEYFHGALVGFTLKVHFAKTYSKASIERECRAFQDDVVKNLQRLKRPDLGIGLDSTFPYHPWSLSYGESPSPSAHGIVGMIITSYDLQQTDDGYDLTLSVDAIRGLRQFIELVLKQTADESGDELDVFEKKQQTKIGGSSTDNEEKEELKKLEAQKNKRARYERELAQMNQREKTAKDKLGRQYKMRMIRYNYYSTEFDKITNEYKRYRENLRLKYGIDEEDSVETPTRGGRHSRAR